jgi:hypothetical protein
LSPNIISIESIVVGKTGVVVDSDESIRYSQINATGDHIGNHRSFPFSSNSLGVHDQYRS